MCKIVNMSMILRLGDWEQNRCAVDLVTGCPLIWQMILYTVVCASATYSSMYVDSFQQMHRGNGYNVGGNTFVMAVRCPGCYFFFIPGDYWIVCL